jgi:RNA polymerase sigma-70 factor (ECF subfamily)
MVDVGAEHRSVEVRTDRSFESFFAAHFGELVGVLAVAAGPEQASDAVQEAFVRAHRQWSRVQRMDRPLAYVRRIAVNQLVDEHRRRSRWERAKPILGSAPVRSAEPGDVDLAAALADLPRGQRLAVVLHYLLDLSVADVAETMHVSSGTVKSQLHDARRALRRKLEVFDA